MNFIITHIHSIKCKENYYRYWQWKDCFTMRNQIWQWENAFCLQLKAWSNTRVHVAKSRSVRLDQNRHMLGVISKYPEWINDIWTVFVTRNLMTSELLDCFACGVLWVAGEWIVSLVIAFYENRKGRIDGNLVNMRLLVRGNKRLKKEAGARGESENLQNFYIW